VKRSRVGVAVFAALPWSWFLVRDAAPLMEVVAVALPVVGVAAVLLMAVSMWTRRGRSFAVIAISTALMVAVSIVLPRLPQQAPDPTESAITVASANVTGDNPLGGEVVETLTNLDADVIVLLEANPHALRAVASITEGYPHVEVADELGLSRVMVVSRFPLQRLALPNDLSTGRLVEVMVAAPEPFTLVAAHLPRPWRATSNTQATPEDQQRLIGDLAEHVAGIEGPVVVAGDLNANDRGVGYRTLIRGGRLRDAIRTGWAATTSLKWWPLLLRIDHVLTRGMCSADANDVTLPGSDHRGLVVEIGTC
jgi:endonuclease/exonuclease/phosphatase (EEP) superfamily protein YafD